MRFILFASIFSFAVAAAVGSADNGETDFNIVEDDTTKLIERQDKKVNIYTNNINYRPYKRTLSKDECDDIVNAYISVLTKKKYKGKSPKETSQNYVVKNYVLRSGSINSLISKNNDVSVNVRNSRDEWFKEIQDNPAPNVKASKIYVADGNKCIWQWRFGGVGNGRYDIQGFNLFYLDEKKKIAGNDVEFNSLAWGVNSNQIKPYCTA